MDLSERIKQKAVELGFDLVGLAPATRAPTAGHFESWLRARYQADMRWLENVDRRSDPNQVLPGAQSIVVVGISYYTADPPAALWEDPLRGRIARYAWGPDYHAVLEPKLKQLADFLEAEGEGTPATRYYVDTGPVLERSFAALAGIGFVGKNTMIISPGLGSYIFLGVILTTAELDYGSVNTDNPGSLGFTNEAGHAKTATCGECTRCLETCPTHAFPAAYVLNSHLCISYLTIELKGSIPLELRGLMGNWIFGCDDCQSCCPWVHRYARPTAAPFLRFDPDTAAPSLVELMALDDAGFRDRFKGTPIQRTKRRGLLRNAAVALGNGGQPGALPALEKAALDPEPLIREHAEWAIQRIRERG